MQDFDHGFALTISLDDGFLASIESVGD